MSGEKKEESDSSGLDVITASLQYGTIVGASTMVAAIGILGAAKRFRPTSILNKMTLTGNMMFIMIPTISFTFVATELEMGRQRILSHLKRKGVDESRAEAIVKSQFSYSSRLIDWYIENKMSIITCVALGSGFFLYRFEAAKKRLQSVDTFFNSRLNFQAVAFISCLGIVVSANLLEQYRGSRVKSAEELANDKNFSDIVEGKK